jgi:hypothetical protein
MGNGFHVEPEQLASHSESVSRIGESVNEIASAAATEGFGGMVYGVLFDSFIVPALSMWAERLHTLIIEDANVAVAIAGALKSNADTYAGIEQANMSTVQSSGSW